MKELSGLRVLVVEDELMVAMILEDILRSAGCIVVGPVSRVAKAMEVAREAAFDAALLDVNVAGQRIYPVVDTLLERRIPFIFMTGYGCGDLPAKFAHHPVIAKPFKGDEVVTGLTALALA